MQKYQSNSLCSSIEEKIWGKPWDAARERYALETLQSSFPWMIAMTRKNEPWGLLDGLLLLFAGKGQLTLKREAIDRLQDLRAQGLVKSIVQHGQTWSWELTEDGEAAVIERMLRAMP